MNAILLMTLRSCDLAVCVCQRTRSSAVAEGNRATRRVSWNPVNCRVSVCLPICPSACISQKQRQNFTKFSI